MVGEILVGDLAPVMVMCCIIERSVDSEVGVEVAHVVGNYVNHDQDVALVAGVDEILEIFL